MNETSTQAAPAKPRRTYVGRRSILNEVMSKTDSTKHYILKKLEGYFQKREDAAAKIKKVAKTLGLKVTRLEMK